MIKVWMVLGCVYGASAVALSAVAAHALPATLAPRGIASIQSAIQMQGWHAIALVMISLWMLHAPPAALTLANLAGVAFALGVLLFSGSIFAMTLAGLRLGPTAPAGGLLLIAGWLLLGASGLAASSLARGRLP